MSAKFSYAVVLSAFLFAAVNAEYVKNDNSNCSVTNGDAEDCVLIGNCPEAMSLIENATDSITNAKRDYLRSIHCGWLDDITPLVCCPQDTTFLDRTLLGLNTPHKHRNLHLLTKHDCGLADELRIFAGDVAGLYEFPWMVLLAYNVGKKKEYQCGGSLINERYVLTAAHCITNQLVGVRIGDHNIKRHPDCITYLNKKFCAPAFQDFEYEKIIKHEKYVRKTITNDIALIRLKGTVDLSKRNAHPICLPIYSSWQNIQLEGQKVWVAGWGLTEKDKTSDVLLKVAVKVNTNRDCIEKYNVENILEDELFLTDHKLCAGDLGKDSCKGDSGGPLIYPGLYQNKAHYVQYGIVSYGTEACEAKAPGIYTKLTKYLDWILDNIEP